MVAMTAPATEAGVTDAEFRRALGRLGGGVTVVTLRTSEGVNHGMTASAVCSLSLSPPLVLVAVKRGSRTHGHLTGVDGFAINLLAEDQEALSNRFAGGTVGPDGRWVPWPAERDKFADLSYARGQVSSAPLLDGALASLDCRCHRMVPGGDHTIFIGKVESIRFSESNHGLRPLLYFAGSYRSLEQDPVEEALQGLRVPDWFD